LKVVVFTCGDAQYVFGQKIAGLLSQHHEIEVYSASQLRSNTHKYPLILKSVVFRQIRGVVNLFGEWVLQLFLLSIFCFFRVEQAFFKKDSDYLGFVSKLLISAHDSNSFTKRLVKLFFVLSPSFRIASHNSRQGLIFQDYLKRVAPDRVVFVEENIFDYSIFALNAAKELEIDIFVVQYSSGIKAELLNYLNYETKKMSYCARFVVRGLTPSFLITYRNSTLYLPIYVSIQCLLVGKIPTFPFSGYLGYATSYMTDNDADYLDLPVDTKDICRRHRIEPVDVTYHRSFKSASDNSSQVAVLLPPDQFFNTDNLNTPFSSYEDLLGFILSSFMAHFSQIDKVYFYLHPRSRMYMQSLQSRYPNLRFSNDNYVDSLSNIRLAVVFGSATYKVFGYLGIETLNFGIYGFDYHEVFEGCGFPNHTYVKTPFDFLRYLQTFHANFEFHQPNPTPTRDKSILDFFSPTPE
jgi:hypothetical protein